jgi:hypothetical protein
MTGRVKDMILNPDETGKLPEVISEGSYYGMRTFDQALLEHVQNGRVSMETALKYATHPHDFKLLVSSDGQRSTAVAIRRRPSPSSKDFPKRLKSCAPRCRSSASRRPARRLPWAESRPPQRRSRKQRPKPPAQTA